jgi:transcriptional regulator with XRE-family HTH domain
MPYRLSFGLVSALGAVIREVRRRRGLSQRSLAIRAGTQQATISRIERGEESPAYERFEQLLLVMGERPRLATEPLDHGVNPSDLADERARTPEERLAMSLSWNRLATEFAVAGAQARAWSRHAAEP